MNWMMTFVYLLSVGVWTGSIVFFSTSVTRKSRAMQPLEASGWLRGVFAEFYLMQIICGAVAFMCALGLLANQQFASKLVGMINVIVLAVLTGMLIWIRQAVLPRMAKMRERMALFREEGNEPDKSLASEWQQLHSFTVAVNIVTVVINLLLLAQLLSPIFLM